MSLRLLHLGTIRKKGFLSEFEKIAYWLNYRPKCPEVADLKLLFCHHSYEVTLNTKIIFISPPDGAITDGFGHSWKEGSGRFTTVSRSHGTEICSDEGLCGKGIWNQGEN